MEQNDKEDTSPTKEQQVPMSETVKVDSNTKNCEGIVLVNVSGIEPPLSESDSKLRAELHLIGSAGEGRTDTNIQDDRMESSNGFTDLNRLRGLDFGNISKSDLDPEEKSILNDKAMSGSFLSRSLHNFFSTQPYTRERFRDYIETTSYINRGIYQHSNYDMENVTNKTDEFMYPQPTFGQGYNSVAIQLTPKAIKIKTPTKDHWIYFSKAVEMEEAFLYQEFSDSAGTEPITQIQPEKTDKMCITPDLETSEPVDPGNDSENVDVQYNEKRKQSAMPKDPQMSFLSPLEQLAEIGISMQNRDMLRQEEMQGQETAAIAKEKQLPLRKRSIVKGLDDVDDDVPISKYSRRSEERDKEFITSDEKTKQEGYPSKLHYVLPKPKKKTGDVRNVSREMPKYGQQLVTNIPRSQDEAGPSHIPPMHCSAATPQYGHGPINEKTVSSEYNFPLSPKYQPESSSTETNIPSLEDKISFIPFRSVEIKGHGQGLVMQRSESAVKYSPLPPEESPESSNISFQGRSTKTAENVQQSIENEPLTTDFERYEEGKNAPKALESMFKGFSYLKTVFYRADVQNPSTTEPADSTSIKQIIPVTSQQNAPLKSTHQPLSSAPYAYIREKSQFESIEKRIFNLLTEGEPTCSCAKRKSGDTKLKHSDNCPLRNHPK